MKYINILMKKKPNPKEYILDNSIYIKFKSNCDSRSRRVTTFICWFVWIRGIKWEVAWGRLLGAENVLYFNVGSCYTSVLHMCKFRVVHLRCVSVKLYTKVYI